MDNKVELNMDLMLNTQSDIENLKFAVYCDNFDTVEKLLKRNKSLINKQDTTGRTPIFWNIETEMFEFLLQYGPDLNHKDIFGSNILQYMFDNPVEAARIPKILTSIDRVNEEVCWSRNYRGMTLLHFIQEMHNLQGLEGDNEFTCESCKDFVNILIRRGVSLNTKDVFGRTALHMAASCGCLESIKLLLNAGVNIQIHESLKIWSHICSASDADTFEECLDVLLENGCSTNYADDDGNALHIALSSGSPKFNTIKWLIKNDIDVLCLDSMGNTAIHNCIRHLAEEIDIIGTEKDELASIESDNEDCIRYLSDNGIDLNKQNRFGFTALHYAVDLVNVNLVTVLLQLGADINIHAFTGETAMHRAVKEHVYTERFANFFSDSCLDVSQVDNYGSTPLHWAVMYRNGYILGQPKALELFDEFVDSKGRTPNDLLFAHDLVQIIDSAEFRCPENKDMHIIDHTYSKRHSTKVTRDNDDIVQDMDTGDKGNEHATVEAGFRKDLERRECDPSDPFGLCPRLCEVLMDETFKDLNEIHLEDWMLHVAEHQTGIREFIDIVVNANEMGLTQNLVENGQVQSAVNLVMEEFARRMSLEDPLFTCCHELMGSYREGTKVFRPDEFDYVFRFTCFQEAFNPEEVGDFPGFIRLELKPGDEYSAFKPYVDKNGYLDAVKFVPKFYKSCNSVLRDADFMKSTNLYPRDTLFLAACSIDNIELRWVGPTIKDLNISVDIVPAFGLNSWIPDCICVSNALLKDFDIHPTLIAVFKTQDEKLVEGWSTFLRASVAILEIAVMEALPLPIKKGYILVKALKGSNIFPQVRNNSGEPGFIEFLTSYMIKCSFFHVLETNFEEIIKEKGIMCHGNKTGAIQWAERIIERITHCIEDKHLPGFFIKNTEFLRDAANRVIDEEKVTVGLAKCKFLKKMLEIAG